MHAHKSVSDLTPQAEFADICEEHCVCEQLADVERLRLIPQPGEGQRG